MSAFSKTRSLVQTSDRLFERIAEEVEKVFPKCKWKDFVSAVSEAESVSRELVLVSPPHGRNGKRLIPVSLLLEAIEGNTVSLKIVFPMYGPALQQDFVLRYYLHHLGLQFGVQGGGVKIDVVLPFIPVEVRFGANGHNGDGQKSFICPEEVISVS